jgi:23S rRNA U2552 (ribose-2'-O)-methylase RlmE/FtsJ
MIRIKNISNNFKINIKQGKFELDNQEQIFEELDNDVLMIINKYIKFHLSSEIFSFTKNIQNKIYYDYISFVDISYFIYKLKKYNLKNVLIISSNLNTANAIEYLNEHFKNETINYNLVLLQKYSRINDEIFNSNLEKFNNKYNTIYTKKHKNNNILVYNNIIKQLEDIDYILPKCNKYNFMILDTFNSNNKLYDMFIYTNEYIYYSNKIYTEILLVQIYNIFNNLNVNGDCIIYLKIPYNKELKQLLYYLTSKFKFYKYERLIYKWIPDMFIILKDFKGVSEKDIKFINNLYNKYKKIYPENINKQSINVLTKKSIINILTPNSITNFNIFINKLDNFVNTIINNINEVINEGIYLQNEIKNNNKLIIQYYTERKIININSIAKLIGIKLLPRLEEQVFQDKFGKTILTNIYSFDNYIWYKFKKYKQSKFHFNIIKDEIHKNLINIPQKLFMATRIIDHRDAYHYFITKRKIRYYEKSLSKYIENNFTFNRKISRAFLKSYEIIETANLINNKLKNFNVFFICEAPGAFILALNHYIHTKTNIENYNWTAQTLHPKQLYQNEKAFGDDYKLMKNFPDRWDFGNKNTGDVTDKDNIKYYREKYKDKQLHLVTGDCGVSLNNDTSNLTEKLHIAQIIIMLSILKKGGNFVLKLYLPAMYPIYISLFYLIYTRFSSFEFYKSFQNSWSPEFYIIGQNYQEPISNNEFNDLLSLITKFNINNSIIEMNKIPEEFILQIENILNNLISNYKHAIDIIIYFIDNIKDMTKKDMDKLQLSIKNKNEDWAKIFKIKKINKKFLIH